MASEDIVLRIKAKMDTGDVSGAVKDLQAAFNRMNLTGNVKEEFNKTFKDLIKSAETFENKAKGSFEKVADLNALKKSSKEVESLFNGLLKDLKRLSSQDSDDIFEFDLSGIKKMNEEIDSLTKKAKTAAASAVDIEKVGTALKNLSKMTSKKEGFGLLENLKVGDLGAATADFQKLQGHLKNFAKGSETAKSAVNEFLAALDSGDVDQINAKLDVLTNNIKTIGKGDTGNLLFFADGLKDIAIQLQKAATTTQEFQREIDGIRANNMEDLLNQTRLSVNALEAFVRAAHQSAEGSRQFGMNVNDAASGVHNLSTEINDIKQRAVSFLSLENSIDLFKQGVRKAIDTVKELDAAMAETAVVTDFSIGDMWDKLPEYTEMANELGVATQGVYEASTLYYQQGLQTEQVMALTTETLKMARIAGLDCAEATDLMTAALRGFNMEINETNAQRVNDVYSELAAITAADTQEIATAMTKTASIAASANMELETTAALLAQMIETTREPAETAGTAMKTIVARFTEMKKAIGDTVTVEGEQISVNKVEEALKSAGVALRDANGEFRDLDDVLLELASKWDSLDIMTQRYIATTAAGSRQQSRFIAMMQDYDRTVQLVDAAYSSAGSSSEQFAKTQESLESKLARLKNAWDTFLMGIADDQIIKSIIDLLTGILNVYNQITSSMQGLGGSAFRVLTAFLALRGGKKVVESLAGYFLNLKNNITGVSEATEKLAKSTKKLSSIEKLTQRINNKKTSGRFVTDQGMKKPTFKESFGQAYVSGKQKQQDFQQAIGLSDKIDISSKKFQADVDKAANNFKQRVSEAGDIEKQGSIEETAEEQRSATLETAEEQRSATMETANENKKVNINTKTPSKNIEFKKDGMDVDLPDKAIDNVIDDIGEGAVNVGSEMTEGLTKDATNEVVEAAANQAGDAAGDAATAVATSGGQGLSAALGSLTSVLTNPYVLAAVAIVAAISAACIVAWKNSAGEVSKNIAAANAAALDQTEKQLAVLKEQIADINTKWDALLENQEVIDSLIQGTAAWNDKVKENNELIREMLTLYPQLAEYLVIDPTTGQLSFTEEGMNAYVENLEKDEEILSFRKSYQKIITDYSEKRSDAIDEAASKDDIATWTHGVESLEENYLEALQIEYSIYQQKMGKGPMPNADLDTILADTGFQTHIEGLGEDGYNEMTVFAGTADPYAAYEYFTNINKSKGSYDTDFELMAKDYLESTDNYSQEAITAASKYYAQNTDYFEEIEEIEEETDYGTMWAKGISGTASEWKDTVEDIVDYLGYTEKVSSTTNTYKNPETGEIINVDRIGGDAPGEDTYTSDGETISRVSDEWLLNQALIIMETEDAELGVEGYEDKENKTQQEMMKEYAEFFDNNKDLAAIYNGDIWVELPTVNEVNWELEDGTDLSGTVFGNDMEDLISNTYAKQKEVIWDYEQLYGFNLAYGESQGQVLYTQNQLDFMKNLQNFSKKTNPYLVDMYIALSELDGAIVGLDKGVWNEKSAIKNFAVEFHELDITAENFANFVNSISFDSAIKGAKQLKRAMEKTGTQDAAMASYAWNVSYDQFNAQAQFNQLTSEQSWAEIDMALNSLLDNDGHITADEIRSLGSEYKILADMLEIGEISATALAEAFEDLEEGTVSLSQLNAGLIDTYKSLYASQDLAMDAILNMEKVTIGKSETELGKIIEEYYDNIEDLISRGAEGDAQIGDYMSALVGKDTWDYYLAQAGGYQTVAVENLDKIYHFSAANGNMAGVWRQMIESKPNDIFGFKNGKISWNLTGIKNTADLVSEMAINFGITEEYARAMVGDLTTYSEEFAATLYSLDKTSALESFIMKNSLITPTGDGVVFNMSFSEKQWDAFASTFGYETGDEFKEVLKGLVTSGTYTVTNEEGSQETITPDFETDDTEREFSRHGNLYRDKTNGVWGNWTLTPQAYSIFNKEVQKYAWLNPNDGPGVGTDTRKEGDQDLVAASEELTSAFSILTQASKYTATEVQNATDTLVREFMKIPGAQEIYETWLPTLKDGEGNWDDEKVAQFREDLSDGDIAYIDTTTAELLTTDEALTSAEQYAEYASTALYNELGETIEQIVNILKENPVTIAVSFTGTDGLLKLLSGEGEIKIGGGSTGMGEGGGGFDPIPLDGIITINGDEEIVGEDEYGDDPGTDTGGGATEADKLNYAEENSNRQLEALERIRKGIDREAELIDKLPEEIAGPLKLLNMGEQMLAEYKEIQINKNKLAALELEEDNAQAEAEYLGEYYYYDEFLESYMYDVEKMEGASPETAAKVQGEYNELQELRNKINEVNDELDGGKIQKIVKGLAKASTAASKALKGTEKASDMLNDAFGDLAEKFGLADELDRLGKSIDKAIDESEFLKREFKGLGIVSEETLSKIDNLPLGDATKDLIKNTLGTNENGTIGSWLGDAFGAGGEMLGGMGDLLNFDMMGMGLDMFNQMKDMASKMIQYVVQFVQTIVNWWINREDWLYNLLSAIEQEVHNFNRQEQVEERFRLYSDEGLNDLVSAWEAMRESLEKQINLNEQLIKSRQAELQFLNLTNLPFSPAFYYDYTEERVIENPWVYDIYILLLDIGAMIPEIGGIFSSIKQLMEDNKKRMEEAVEEIEDAREEILELEKKQLELRTKYMEDEIELEELVMDTIIEKQQEEIDELTAMNDAITAGNEKLIETLNSKLDLIRQQRDNEDKEEELGEKERRLAYLRQDTSNANRAEIYDLQDELKDERRDYTDELIDQKISALEEQNEKAAEQRQQQIDLLQAQLDHTEKYGLQWAEAQTLIKNGFDSEGRLRVGTDLFDMLMSKEEFTSMGLGSTRQVQQIMDWNVTSIAAAAFREINDIWDEGFGNFAMSNDVHDQSRLHLWADREVDYRQLPSWLSFLQPAYNTIQDYLWRTGNNVEAFVETGFLSGKNSSSILGKTIVPLIQSIAGNIATLAQGESLTLADGAVTSVEGAITRTYDKASYDWGERAINGIGNVIADAGNAMVRGIRDLSESNSLSTQSTTQSVGEVTINNYINSEDVERGESIGENIFNAFREGISNLSIFK